jgi:hypothetical protein
VECYLVGDGGLELGNIGGGDEKLVENRADLEVNTIVFYALELAG